MTPLRITPVIITVNRRQFRLCLWKMKANKYRRAVIFPITIGAIGHDTPTGMYFVGSKDTEPDWLAPHADWVPKELQGHIFPITSEHNPFAGGFMSLGGSDGVGIHGVKFDPQLGTKSSHGCIRLATKDFLHIYSMVPKGAPVFIY